MKRLARVVLPLAAILALRCGKKSEPLPPVPPLPSHTSDLKVEQQGEIAEVSFTLPQTKMDGTPLTDLAAVEIYRILSPGPSLTHPPPPASTSGSGTSADHAPISGQRRRAETARIRERSLLEGATKLAVIRSDLFPSATRGGQLLYHDSLVDLLKRPGGVPELGYAVVTVRRNGLRSEISNVATIKPVTPPGAPQNLLAVAQEQRICLTWEPPAGDVAGKAIEILGYKIYRRRLEDEDYGAPINASPVESTDYGDSTAAYGSEYVYTVTAIPKDHPTTEGPPAIQFGLRYEDVYPPPPVERLDALPEQNLVRLSWTPVEAPDLAGYDLYRSENGGPETRLNEKPLVEVTFVDTHVVLGRSYVYRVRSVDRSGNASAPSPPANAKPFTEE